MNLPNKLSLLRVMLIPVLVVRMYLPGPLFIVLATAVFGAAAFTDYLDGHIARRDGLVTDFGKFIDPVADKLLNLSAMIMLIHCGMMPAWVVIIILARELAVDGLRMVAVEQGKVIAAGKLGKIKTTVQITLIIVHLVYFAHFPLLHYLAYWLMSPTQIAMGVMTVWSGVDYILNNKEVLHG